MIHVQKLDCYCTSAFTTKCREFGALKKVVARKIPHGDFQKLACMLEPFFPDGELSSSSVSDPDSGNITTVLITPEKKKPVSLIQYINT